mgnify:CR=1 FL=1
MASGTVGYTDTRGNKDFSSVIASQIGKRLKEASDMAADERAFASQKAEEGGTSLEEAGIGKGYFFKRALGNRFGGDRIARTKGRLGIGGAGTNPTGDFKSRFRGGFDYNVTNELSSIPISNALTAGLRGVESGLVAISQSLSALSSGMGDLARAQEDAAKQAILNGAFMQAFLNHMQREASRQRAGKEERGLERGLLGGGSGRGSGRGMINVTPRGGASSATKGNLVGDTVRRGADLFTNRAAYKYGGKGLKGATTAGKTLKLTGDFIKMPKAIDPLAGLSKGARNMIKMGSGIGAMPNLVKRLTDGAGKVTKNARTFSNLGRTITRPGASKKIIKQLGRSKDAMVDFAGKTLNRTGDVTDIVEIGAKTPRNIKKTYSIAENLVTSGDDGARAAVNSVDVMKQAKNLDTATDGLSTAKTLAAASDAGVQPNLLKRFIFGTKPKGLVRGSALTRMLIKNPAGKMFLKKLPLIGAIAGTIFAAQRLMEGDFLGAGLEFSSGLLGAVGASPLSLGLDGFLLARDFGAVPFAQGGIITKPTLSMMGENRQKEGVFPLQGAEGRRTFKMFGEGALEARLDNESKDTKLQALGHKTYYETMGGWEAFGKGLLKALTNMKDSVGDFLNPFKNLKREKGPGEGKNQWWDFMDVFPNPQVSNPNDSSELANLLNSSSAQTSLGNMFISPTTIVNNYSTVASGNGEEEVGSSAFPYSFAAFNADFSLYSK